MGRKASSNNFASSKESPSPKTCIFFEEIFRTFVLPFRRTPHLRPAAPTIRGIPSPSSVFDICSRRSRNSLHVFVLRSRRIAPRSHGRENTFSKMGNVFRKWIDVFYFWVRKIFFSACTFSARRTTTLYFLPVGVNNEDSSHLLLLLTFSPSTPRPRNPLSHSDIWIQYGNCHYPPTSRPPDGFKMMLASFTAKAWVSTAAFASRKANGPQALLEEAARKAERMGEMLL